MGKRLVAKTVSGLKLTEESQKVLWPIQVGWRRRLVIQRVVIRSQLPTQNLLGRANRTAQFSGVVSAMLQPPVNWVVYTNLQQHITIHKMILVPLSNSHIPDNHAVSSPHWARCFCGSPGRRKGRCALCSGSKATGKRSRCALESLRDGKNKRKDHCQKDRSADSVNYSHFHSTLSMINKHIQKKRFKLLELSYCFHFIWTC